MLVELPSGRIRDAIENVHGASRVTAVSRADITGADHGE
jgi:hypothetical protein